MEVCEDVDWPWAPSFKCGVSFGVHRSIEVIEAGVCSRGVSHAIFDFDGTLSWLRHGWPRIMLDVCLRFAASESPPHQDEHLHQVISEILSLNGKPSIHQILRVRDLLGFTPGEPSAERIMDEYTDTLRGIVGQRLRSAEQDPDAFLIFGSRPLLITMKKVGIRMIVVSGTYEADVRKEAELLGLTGFFGEHIYGAPARGAFSKKDVIDRFMKDEAVEGHRLIAFGDGPVEIEFAKAVGGLAIGVASDEAENGSHRVDPVKRQLLIAAGADAIIPDYVDAVDLLRHFLGHEH